MILSDMSRSNGLHAYNLGIFRTPKLGWTKLDYEIDGIELHIAETRLDFGVCVGHFKDRSGAVHTNDVIFRLKAHYNRVRQTLRDRNHYRDILDFEPRSIHAPTRVRGML